MSSIKDSEAALLLETQATAIRNHYETTTEIANTALLAYVQQNQSLHPAAPALPAAPPTLRDSLAAALHQQKAAHQLPESSQRTIMIERANEEVRRLAEALNQSQRP